jgi:hypothetical protein
MKPRFEVVLEACIESGVQMGVRRAYKHTDDPTEQQIIDCVTRAVNEQIDFWFMVPASFDDDQDYTY